MINCLEWKTKVIFGCGEQSTAWKFETHVTQRESFDRENEWGVD